MRKFNALNNSLINANDKMLSVEDVAEIFRIKPSSVRKKVERGLLPFHKMRGSKRLWFSKVEIISLMKQGNDQI